MSGISIPNACASVHKKYTSIYTPHSLSRWDHNV